MKKIILTKPLFDQALIAQECEITEHFVYARLAEKINHKKNSQILHRISKDEMGHYQFWKNITGQDVLPNKWRISFFVFLARIFGLTFAIQLMERGEAKAQLNYEKMAPHVPGLQKVIYDEERHEQELIGLLEERKLQYVGSIVLGLNDALVELTGGLAGLSLAFQDTRMVASSGLIIGIAASLSMASSEYLSMKMEDNEHKALKAAVYTGLAYIGTVIGLILPYFIFEDYRVALGTMLLVALLIIFFFNFYISVVKNISFKKRFWEMVGISFGVAGFSFFIGYFVRIYFDIEI